MIDGQDLEEVVLVVTNDINYFEDPSSQNVIVPINQDQHLAQNQESSQVSKYQAFSEFLIVELNRRYVLRPRQGPGRPIKKVTFDEPQVKATEIPPVQPPNQLQEQLTTEKTCSNCF